MPAPGSRLGADEWLWHDRLLRGAVAGCGLLIGYQLLVTLLQPPWIGPVTDWLRAALAWPALLLVVLVSRWLTRARRPEVRVWWMISAAMLSYAIARTWWTIADTLIYPQGVPFPIPADLFFVLQYPFFFLALVLAPLEGFWGPRLIVLLDSLLWVGAAAAISWYILFEPILVQSGLSPLARGILLAYPVTDLFLFFALLLTLLRPCRYEEDRPVVDILLAAFCCLIVADVWVNIIIHSHPQHVYRTGQGPDLFWLAFYLLVPLAALVQLRVAQHHPSRIAAAPSARGWIEWADVKAGARFFLPIVAALVASVVVLFTAARRAGGAELHDLMIPLAVSSGLLLLVVLRQGIAYLENARLRRETEAVRAEALAQTALNRRKDEFLGVLSHELRTPLTTVQGYIEMVTRRLDAWRLPAEGTVGTEQSPAREALARHIGQVHTMLDYAQAGVRRITRLADDLLDDTRIHHGRLGFHREVCDLGAIVRAAVEEQRAAEPDRPILLELPSAQPTPVLADRDRIAQVLTNYLTNALKYSKEGRPVVVRLEVEGEGQEEEEGQGEGGARARVSVRDEGIGVPFAEQAHVWERFHQAEGVRVQSGSGVSLGLGLHISKTIIEAHHGQVGLDSAPGRGSTFWFTLPLLAPSSRASVRDTV